MNMSSVFRPLGLAVALTTAVPVIAATPISTTPVSTTPISTTPVSISSDVIQRGWKPSVEFSGAGD